MTFLRFKLLPSDQNCIPKVEHADSLYIPHKNILLVGHRYYKRTWANSTRFWTCTCQMDLVTHRSNLITFGWSIRALCFNKNENENRIDRKLLKEGQIPLVDLHWKIWDLKQWDIDLCTMFVYTFWEDIRRL